MALYAREYDGGFPRKPMLIPPFDNPKYKEIRVWFQEGEDGNQFLALAPNDTNAPKMREAIARWRQGQR